MAQWALIVPCTFPRNSINCRSIYLEALRVQEGKWTVIRSGLFSSAEPWGRSSGSSASGSVRLSCLGASWLSFLGSFVSPNQKIFIKAWWSILQTFTEEEFREIGFRAGNNPVIKGFDQACVSPRALSATHTNTHAKWPKQQLFALFSFELFHFARRDTNWRRNINLSSHFLSAFKYQSQDLLWYRFLFLEK